MDTVKAWIMWLPLFYSPTQTKRRHCHHRAITSRWLFFGLLTPVSRVPSCAARLHPGVHTQTPRTSDKSRCRLSCHPFLVVPVPFYRLSTGWGEFLQMMKHFYWFFMIQTLFRVWDVFLVDGLDVLFRIALGILRNNESELLGCASIPTVYVALENLPTRMWEADKLLQVRSLITIDVFGTDFVHVSLRSTFVALLYIQIFWWSAMSMSQHFGN